MKRVMVRILAIWVCGACLSGCAVLDKFHKADELSYELSIQKRKTEKLKKDSDAALKRAREDCEERLARLQDIKQEETKEVIQAKNRELSELEKAKLELEQKLSDEIGEYKAKLKMTERGLVVTFISEIFFDSGKDQIKSAGESSLQKVADVLKTNLAGSNLAIEGHTDDDPIKRSGWKSNWELSTARALAVVHFFIDKSSLSPERLSAVGFGQYHPVAGNDTGSGRQQNRRVEIVILPSNIKKIK